MQQASPEPSSVQPANDCAKGSPSPAPDKLKYTQATPVSAHPDYLGYAPLASPADLQAGLSDSQSQTLRVFDQLGVQALNMPKLPTVNPPLWELGHVAWFHEFWVHRGGDCARPSRLRDADALFNSSQVAHDTRWDLPLPPAAALRSYLTGVVDDTLALLHRMQLQPDPARLYFIQLALFHQDMHNEAFAYSWQTAGWPWPAAVPPNVPPNLSPNMSACAAARQLTVHAADIALGAHPATGFIFDNEKWAQRVPVPAFTIDSAPVSNAAYLAYVEEDPAQRMPRYWRRSQGQWQQRVFAHWLPLDLAAPVCHVSALEAEAYCASRKRRLPGESEWLRLAEVAPAQAFAGVWEWTSSVFAPFAGFRPDPYADYSQPWFDGRHRVLKGGSRWTPARLQRAGFRNFYQTDRGDVFAGFRTCAITPEAQ